jgi:hypothetical protein
MIAQAQVWLKTGPHDASRVDTTLQTYYCLSATNHSSRLSHAMAIWHFFLSYKQQQSLTASTHYIRATGYSINTLGHHNLLISIYSDTGHDTDTSIREIF